MLCKDSFLWVVCHIFMSKFNILVIWQSSVIHFVWFWLIIFVLIFDKLTHKNYQKLIKNIFIFNKSILKKNFEKNCHDNFDMLVNISSSSLILAIFRYRFWFSVSMSTFYPKCYEEIENLRVLTLLEACLFLMNRWGDVIP